MSADNLLKLARENNLLGKAGSEVLIPCWELLSSYDAKEQPICGETLSSHSLNVAGIVVSEIGLGIHSLNAALLHELMNRRQAVAKDVLATVTTSDARLILSGLKKIQSIRTDRTQYQSENFIKLLLTVAEDVRSSLVQLADRLHHLRHATCFPPEEVRLIATEAAYLYAPVAHRLGLYQIKAELEDLAMKVLLPDDYHAIEEKLKESAGEQESYIRDFIQPLQTRLQKNDHPFEIKWRTKSIPSIYGKMKAQGVDFEQVYDVFAVRIILHVPEEHEKAECWKVYSQVTDLYPPNTERLRDWISRPKASGYESLHTTVLGPQRRWVEVQIRSARMDQHAEKGQAAHWHYKDSRSDAASIEWLKSLRELLEHPEPDAFQEAHKAKTDLYSDKIFVFTPDGDLRKLSRGATVLDFAFDVHTRIGSECSGAKVNGRNVTIRHRLENGDHVEIITSKNQHPKSDWLSFVVTSKARTRIKRALKEALHQEAKRGRETLERKFRNWKIAFTDEQIGALIRHFRFKDSVELYAAVANEKLDLRQAKEFLTGMASQTVPDPVEPAPGRPGPFPPKLSNTIDILEIDKDIRRVDYTLARCCNPIFGDDVFGFITVSKGITIHRVSCPNAIELASKYPYRIMRVRWKQSDGTTSYPATIRITGNDKLGIMNSISEVISQEMKVNIRSLSFDSQGGKFEGILSVNIFDAQHLDALLRKLRKISGVTRAWRAD